MNGELFHAAKANAGKGDSASAETAKLFDAKKNNAKAIAMKVVRCLNQHQQGLPATLIARAINEQKDNVRPRCSDLVRDGVCIKHPTKRYYNENKKPERIYILKHHYERLNNAT